MHYNEPYLQVDFHTHSTASDGVLTPTQLVSAAHAAGIKHLALTDHDTVAGLEEAKQAAQQYQIEFTNGIEISVTWEKRCFHIVGLNINPHNEDLRTGLNKLAQERLDRAEKMAQKLEKLGMPGCFAGAAKLAGKGMLTRSHLARYLLESGYISDPQQAFDRYLKPGKPAYVNTNWAELEQALTWIKNAGGVAVVAHPMRYKLTNSWMRRFLTAFCNAGGTGIEIVTGNGTPDTINRSARLAREFDLLGSVGSDFHTPEARWIRFGKLASLPIDINPIWGETGFSSCGVKAQSDGNWISA